MAFWKRKKKECSQIHREIRHRISSRMDRHRHLQATLQGFKVFPGKSRRDRPKRPGRLIS